MSPKYERSIPLEGGQDEDALTSPFASSKLSEKDMDAEITRLKTASSNKFKQKWESILEKYSAIDDDLESDEIDLATGRITIDNGHLRSMAIKEIEIGGVIVNGDIWAEDDSYDKAYNDHRKLQLQQEKLKKKFDHHIRVHRESSPQKRIDVPDDNLHHAFSSPVKNGPSAILALSSSEASDFSDAVSSPFKSRMNSLPSSPLKSSSQMASPTKRPKLQTPSRWFNCAFEYCEFLAEKKGSYVDHLLTSHRAELSYIGYPVKGDHEEVENYITELCVRKLALYFPIGFDEVAEHDFLDESKCPILGCEFMPIKGQPLSQHILTRHPIKAPKMGLPPRADVEASRSSTFSSSIHDNPGLPQFKIPELVIKESEDEALVQCGSSAGSRRSSNSNERKLWAGEGNMVDTKEEDGYDSIDEFFNDN